MLGDFDLPRFLLQLGRENLTREQIKVRLREVREHIVAFAETPAIEAPVRETILRGIYTRLTGKKLDVTAVDPAARLAIVLEQLDRPGRGRPVKGDRVTTRLDDAAIAWLDTEILRRGIPTTLDDTGRPELLRRLVDEAMARSRPSPDQAAGEAPADAPDLVVPVDQRDPFPTPTPGGIHA